MEQLRWLPSHPDLSSAIKAARGQTDPERRLCDAIALTGYRRDFIATEKLDRLIADCPTARAGSELPALMHLQPARLAVLSSHTVDHLVPGMRVAGLGRRLALDITVTPYGLYRAVLAERDAELAAFAPDFILLALDSHEMAFDLAIDASEAEVARAVQERVADLARLWRAARSLYGAQVIQQTFLPAAPPLFGSLERVVPASPSALAERLNDALRDAARSENVLLFDLDLHGRHLLSGQALADPVRWHQAKQLVSPIAAPVHGDLVARLLAAALGLSRKCLVMDLDNTLWGGVVGDDGVEGIRLGQGDALGEAFLAIQGYVALLGRRGVVLAICSKNDPRIAEAAFSDHPEMVLHRQDIACFMANWDDKATNLRRIAQDLSLGLDSLVFLDDNPAERDIVRRELPVVAVPELPEDVADYPVCLSEAGYFEAATFTRDDAGRAQSYRAKAAHHEALAQTTDMEGYLRGLSMTLVASEIRPVDLPRAAQLINKSNQFNLTTRRYTETELEEMITDPRTIAMCFRLHDKFADHGLISVVIARPDPEWEEQALLIDTWLMSCRVLGRQVEAAAVEALAAAAARRGIRWLIGEYRPTPRNALVADHYGKLGFEPQHPPAEGGNAVRFWRHAIGDTPIPAHVIKLKGLQ